MWKIFKCKRKNITSGEQLQYFQILDTILTELDNANEKRLSYNNLANKLNNIGIDTGLKVMVEQLKLESYIFSFDENVNDYYRHLDFDVGNVNYGIRYYYLTGKGKIFIDAGGYSALDKFGNEKRRAEKLMVTITWWIGVGTVIAAIYYTLEILDKIWSIYPYKIH